MKKVFIIFTILFSIALLFWGVYNFAFKKPEINTSTESKKTAENAQKFAAEKKAQGKIYSVTDAAVLDAVLEKKKEKIIFYASDGTTWQMDQDGKNKEELSDKKIEGLQSLNWTNDRSKVISQIVSGGEQKFFIYDFAQNKTTQIPKQADLITWDNLGAKIIYKYFDEKTKKRSLNVADQDGSNWKVLVNDVPWRKIDIHAVPQTSLISFWNMPSSQEESVLQTVSVLGGETKTVLRGRWGADYLWSPDGNKALVSSLISKDEKKMALGLVDQAGKYDNLDVPTLVSKAIWSNDKKTVYYALPGGIPESANLPEDYQAGKFKTKDTFWKIDTTTGNKQRLLDPAEIKDVYDAKNMFLSTTEDALFFVNSYDGKLYKIEL